MRSHQRGRDARDAGAFDKEIVAIMGRTADGGKALHQHDEGIRDDASMEAMAQLKILMEDGALTAANASQICDGSSAVMIASEQALKDHNLTPLARIHNLTVTAGDPVIMLEEPLFATDRALKRAGMSIHDMDLYEVNEAFASVVLRFEQAFGVDHDKVNVNGGSIAMGHPLGATGAMILGTLLDELERSDKETGLATLCIGSGMGAATIIERV